MQLTPKYEHIKGSTKFSFQTHFLQSAWSFNKQNPLKNQYLPHISSENCEIKSIRFYLSKVFQ
jgi:hypothetical protein